jgi:hypothetical protein
VSHRKRSTWLASALALLLVLILSGLAVGKTMLAEVPAADTIATFEDTNGNGIDDDCEEAVLADPAAEAAAAAAADLNSDGVISVSEAARSGRIGRKNCNHGGYVSWVAHGSPEGTGASADGEPGAGTEATTTDHAAAKAAKDAAKAAKHAAKAAAKAARVAAKAERHAAREAAKAAKEQGKGKSKKH